MKIRTEDKKKVIWMGVLLVIALLVVWRALGSMGWLGESVTTAASVRPAQNTAAPTSIQKKGNAPRIRENSLDPTLRTDLLVASQRVEYEGGGRRNIFRMEAPPPPPPPPVMPTPVQPVRVEPSGPPPPPPPPPITLKFFGFANRAGEAKKVFLSDGDDVFVAKEGDIVNRRYKILQISNTSVMVEDVLNNNRQPVPLTPQN
ncbi:MAG TPA: hypothetical protein VG759_12860 [Candidatus Angelobacter sp.]|nr:hypothetical protein [Candidatus Angelobacter sp.]